MLILDVYLPLHTLSTNERKSMHRMKAARLTKNERTSVGLVLALKGRKLERGETAVVTLCRTATSRSGQLLDDDNLRGALKGVRDAVAKRLGVDDGDVERVTFKYEQPKGSEHGVRILVEVQGTPAPALNLRLLQPEPLRVGGKVVRISTDRWPSDSDC